MSLGAVSETILKQVEAVTGLPVQVESDNRLQAPLLARVQIARGGIPLHRVTYHPSATGMADYLIAFQCSFVMRLYTLPFEERFDLTDTPAARADSLQWAKTHPASSALPSDRQADFADFLRSSLMSMVRSIPVGLWIDSDLRERFPTLREAQEQAIRRQINTHATLLRPDFQQNVPAVPLGINFAINAAFAKFWGGVLGDSGWTLPYLAVGALTQGETLLRRSNELEPVAGNDRRIIEAWAEELGLKAWLAWKPYRP